MKSACAQSFFSTHLHSIRNPDWQTLLVAYVSSQHYHCQRKRGSQMVSLQSQLDASSSHGRNEMRQRTTNSYAACPEGMALRIRSLLCIPARNADNMQSFEGFTYPLILCRSSCLPTTYETAMPRAVPTCTTRNPFQTPSDTAASQMKGKAGSRTRGTIAQPKMTRKATATGFHSVCKSGSHSGNAAHQICC